jgi:alpha-tubulin suppressor-like RCC1 family protein
LLLLALLGLFFITPVQGQNPSTLAGGLNFFAEIECKVLWGWGRNDRGQLGLSDNTNRPTPQPVPLSPALSGSPVSVCTGFAFMCVLDDKGEVGCTGQDTYGQTGVGDSAVDTNVLGIPTGVASVAHVSCGALSVLATTTEGGLMAWGYNGDGGLGLGNTTKSVWEPK